MTSAPYRARTTIIGLAASGLLSLAAPQATGQPYIGAPCAGASAPRFEDHLQSLWYRRFWTGDCKDLPALGCRSGRPNWNQVVRTIVARAPAETRATTTVQVCRLGRRIGFEWTRPKAERRINTQDLAALNDTLEKAPDVASGLKAVEARVRARIGP